MINDWKLGMKMLRYTYNLKMTIVSGILFLAAGIFLTVVEMNSDSGLLGGWFFMCIGLLPTQLLYSLNASGIVQVSSAKKKMQTSVPTFMTFVNMAALYVLELIIQGILIWGCAKRPEQVAYEMFTLVLMTALIMMYLGVSYKYFVISTIVFVPCTICLFSGLMTSGVRYGWNTLGVTGIPLILVVPAGLVVLVMGGLGQYLLSLLFYRAPLSKMAQAAPLRKEL